VLAIPVVPFPPVQAAAAASRFRLNYHITAKKRHLGVGDLTKRSLEINVVKENGPAEHRARSRNGRESVAQQRGQSFGNWFTQDVIIECMKEVFALGPAGEEITNPAVDRAVYRVLRRRQAICGGNYSQLLHPRHSGLPYYN
jgi:hypothetical protein